MREDEKTEFLLSQYLDGTLAPEDRKSLEARLAKDPHLNQKLAEYAQLDELLRTGMPVPRDEWDDLGDRISSAVADLPLPRRRLRFMPFVPAAAALAACLLLAMGIRFRSQRANPPVSESPQPVVEIASAQVIGPAAESPAGSASADVTLGGPPSDADMSFDSSQPIVSQPSHVYIASAANPDGHPMR